MAVDTLGLVWGVCVVPANIHESVGGLEVLARACRASSRVRRVYVDSGYQGQFEQVSWEVFGVEVRVVAKVAGAGFVVLPKRWLVERSFAWLSYARRLDRDYESDVGSRVSWLYVRLIVLALRRLCQLGVRQV